MIRVQAPDGSIVEFPEGTPDDVMANAMRQTFGGPEQGQQPAAPSTWDRVKSGVGNAAQAADDVVRLMASGATLGFADKIASAAGGNTLESERAKTQAARDRSGFVPSIVAEGAGVMLPASQIAKGVGAVAGFAPRVMGQFTQAGVTGALTGAGAAVGNDQDVTTGALVGAGAGVAGQGLANALMGGVNKVAGAFNKQPVIPTRDQIKAAKDAAYKEAEAAGVVYTPDMFKRVRSDVEPQLANMGFDPALQPKIAPVLARLEQAAQTNTTLPGAEVVRRVAANAYEPGNRASNSMMQKIIAALDDATANPRAGEVLMGDAQRGGNALLAARKNASIEFKLDDVARQLEKAKTQAGSTWSGGNIENAQRQKLRAILDNPGRSRGFTPDERAALEQAVMGSGAGHNTARLVGKLSPQGSGLMAALGIGGTAANPMLAAGPLAGIAGKKVSEKMTEANIKQLVDIIAAGGSRSAAVAAPNAIQRLTQSERERLALALMGAGVSVGVPALADK
jgi:hypothetical protein